MSNVSLPVIVATCNICGENFDMERKKLGYETCTYCGELLAQGMKHCVVPMHKSNYVFVYDPEVLKQLNQKDKYNV